MFTKKGQNTVGKIAFAIALVCVCLFPDSAYAACKTATEVMSELYSSCLICTFVDMIFDAVNNVVTACYNTLKKPSLYLLIIGLGLWILWHFGMYFVNYKYQAPEGFFTEIGKCFFRTTLIAAILTIPTQKAFDLVVSPVVSMATELTLGILSTDLNVQSADTAIASGLIKNDICQQFQNSESSSISYDSKGNVVYGDSSSHLALSPQIKSALSCVIRSMYIEAAKGTALGNCIYCYSMGRVDLWIIKIPDMGMFVIGLLVMLVFFIITLSFSFRVIDFVIRISFVTMLLPLLMVAWVFPITRKYTKKAWDLFLHALVALLALAIGMALILKIVMESIGRSEELDSMLNNDQVQQLYQHIYVNGVDWLLFLAIAIIALMLLSKSEAVANHFVSIDSQLQSTNIGAAMGAKMAAMVTTTVQAAVTVAMLATTVATGGAAAVGFAAKGAATAAAGAAKAAKATTSLATKSGRAAARASVKKFANDAKSRAKAMPKQFKDFAGDKVKTFGNNIAAAPQRVKDNLKNIQNNFGENLKDKFKTSAKQRFSAKNIARNAADRWNRHFNDEADRNS